MRHVGCHILVLPSSNHVDSPSYLGDLSFSFHICKMSQENTTSLLEQRFPSFLAPGSGFMEDSFSMDQGLGGWFWDDSRALHSSSLLLCDPVPITGLDQHQPSVWRLGTPVRKALVFKPWSSNQQHQHPPGAFYKGKFSGLTPVSWVSHKPSR